MSSTVGIRLPVLIFLKDHMKTEKFSAAKIVLQYKQLSDDKRRREMAQAGILLNGGKKISELLTRRALPL